MLITELKPTQLGSRARVLFFFFFFFFLVGFFFFFFFFFFGHSVRHVGSQFLYQEWNPCPLQLKHSLNQWTTKEILIFLIVLNQLKKFEKLVYLHCFEFIVICNKIRICYNFTFVVLMETNSNNTIKIHFLVYLVFNGKLPHFTIFQHSNSLTSPHSPYAAPRGLWDLSSPTKD